MKRFFILLYAFSCAVLADENQIRRLENSLNKPREDSAQVNLLNTISREYRNIGEYTKAMSYAEKGGALAEQINFQVGLASVAINKAGIYYLQGNFEHALEQYLLALKIRKTKQDGAGIAQCNRGIGNVYLSQANYPRALEYYLNALGLLEELKDKPGIAANLFSVGNICLYQNNTGEALRYYFKAKKIYEEIAQQQGLMDCLVNIGSIYYKKNNPDSAVRYYSEGLKIAEELDNKSAIAIAMSNMGAMELARNQLQRALGYLQKALSIQEELGDKNYKAINLEFIGLIYQRKGDYSKAIDYYQKGLDLARETGALECVKDAYQNFSSVYATMGNYQRAYEYQQLYAQIKDSLFSEASARQIAEMQTKYNTEKKEQQIALLEKDKEIQGAEVGRQKTVIWFIIIGLALMLTFSVFMFNRWRLTQKQNEIIEDQKQQVELKNIIIEEKNKDITDSINYAKKIQQAKLPTKKEIHAALPDSFILFKPKDIVSGDFYYFHKNGNKTFIASADCTGHGVPGAFMSMIGMEKLEDALMHSHDTSEILSYLNKGIKTSLKQSGRDDSSRDGMDIALCSVDMGQRVLKYAGANRPLWVVRNGSATIEEIKATKKAIGGFTDGDQLFYTHSLRLQRGDSFYIFSDGYADAFNGAKGKKLTTKKFKELLLSIQDKPMSDQGVYLDHFVENWQAGAEQVDDILVIGVRL